VFHAIPKKLDFPDKETVIVDSKKSVPCLLKIKSEHLKEARDTLTVVASDTASLRHLQGRANLDCTEAVEGIAMKDGEELLVDYPKVIVVDGLKDEVELEEELF
jgi:hypothetical protein